VLFVAIMYSISTPASIGSMQRMEAVIIDGNQVSLFVDIDCPHASRVAEAEDDE